MVRNALAQAALLLTAALAQAGPLENRLESAIRQQSASTVRSILTQRPGPKLQKAKLAGDLGFLKLALFPHGESLEQLGASPSTAQLEILSLLLKYDPELIEDQTGFQTQSPLSYLMITYDNFVEDRSRAEAEGLRELVRFIHARMGGSWSKLRLTGRQLDLPVGLLSNGSAEAFKFALELGLDPNAVFQTEDGRPATLFAIASEYALGATTPKANQWTLDVVAELLYHKADPKRDPYPDLSRAPKMPFVFTLIGNWKTALERQDVNVAEASKGLLSLILKKSVLIDEILSPDSMFNMLGWAVRIESPEIVEFLLSSGANPNLPNQLGHTPFMYACLTGNLEILELFLEFHADPTLTFDGPFRPTALHFAVIGAAETGDAARAIATIRFLVLHGADPRVRSVFHNLVDEANFHKDGLNDAALDTVIKYLKSGEFAELFLQQRATRSENKDEAASCQELLTSLEKIKNKFSNKK